MTRNHPTLNFPQFQNLPPEVQQLIWTFSLPDPRIIHLAKHFVKPSGPPPKLSRARLQFGLRSRCPIPALFSVCADSRHIISRTYTLAFGTQHSRPNTWIDFERDTLYLIKDPKHFLGPSEIAVEDRERVQNLAVAIKESTWTVRILGGVLAGYPNARNVTHVCGWAHKDEDLGTVRPFPVHPGKILTTISSPLLDETKLEVQLGYALAAIQSFRGKKQIDVQKLMAYMQKVSVREKKGADVQMLTACMQEASVGEEKPWSRRPPCVEKQVFFSAEVERRIGELDVACWKVRALWRWYSWYNKTHGGKPGFVPLVLR